ncbi:sensor histidine kinase [Bacillus sp. 1NLA3E]|uniref:sensor histidine kinase n=1 Tax=Bacillus sp. 1NLA3E TaxID=666686 RepID=UPI000247EDC1|nr:sensor histidine kinase [Bacillus sp. 1NLA3E]AGK54117.1 sensor histidine kinase [Bacillus sp. 1NLA3E]
MRLFFRQHFPLITFSLLQIALVILVFWFSGFKNIMIIGYAVFLGACVLIAYLVYRFVSQSSFYDKLTKPPKNLEESITITGHTPLAEAMDNFIVNQYRQYQDQLAKWEVKQQDRIIFMNQWVHQMKTPLSVIELIIQGEDDPRFESIAEETLRLRKGLEMALYTSRLDTFTEDFYVEEMTLFDVIDKVITENKQFFIRNYVYPELKVDRTLKIRTDAKWLRFVLDQLLTNAIKYSAGTRQKITITSFAKNNAVYLEIKDRGVGIPDTDLPRVFQPFFTGENGRIFKESTGMGLFLVKEVLEKLNHEITIESEVGKGTTVRIIFARMNDVH